MMDQHDIALAEPDETAQQIKAEPEFLDLLLPQDLAHEMPLEGSEQLQTRAVLSGILHALSLTNPAETLERLQAILTSLEHDAPATAYPGATQIPAKSEQVRDFDRYFKVNRVSSSKPALPMLRSHLQTCTAVLSLCQRSEAFPEEHVARQLAGFIDYTHLLARVFGVADIS